MLEQGQDRPRNWKNFIVYWSFKEPDKDKPEPLRCMHLDYPESVAVAIRALPWAQVLEYSSGSYHTIGYFSHGRRLSGYAQTMKHIDLLNIEPEGNA